MSLRQHLFRYLRSIFQYLALKTFPVQHITATIEEQHVLPMSCCSNVIVGAKAFVGLKAVPADIWQNIFDQLQTAQERMHFSSTNRMIYRSLLSYRQRQISGLFRTDAILIWHSNFEDESEWESKDGKSDSSSVVNTVWSGFDLYNYYIPFEDVCTVKIAYEMHKELMERQCIRVWRYKCTPKCLKPYHFCFDGDENWVALVPPKYAEMNIPWLTPGTIFGPCDVSRNRHPFLNGYIVYVGCHA